MILNFNYEELTALKAGAAAFLGHEGEAPGAVLAPPEERATVEALLPRLVGDLSLSTLGEVRAVRTAVAAIVEFLRVEMEATILATHAASEGAVAAYFDFAHALGVESRIAEIASEMEALIELVTGAPADEETARSFRFPD